jgi:hypothetical protein
LWLRNFCGSGEKHPATSHNHFASNDSPNTVPYQTIIVRAAKRFASYLEAHLYPLPSFAIFAFSTL